MQKVSEITACFLTERWRQTDQRTRADMSSHEQRTFMHRVWTVRGRDRFAHILRECADVVTVASVGGRFNYTARPLVDELYKNQLWTCRTVYRCSISPTSLNIPHIAVQCRSVRRPNHVTIRTKLVSTANNYCTSHLTLSTTRQATNVVAQVEPETFLIAGGETRLRVITLLAHPPTSYSTQSEELRRRAMCAVVRASNFVTCSNSDVDNIMPARKKKRVYFLRRFKNKSSAQGQINHSWAGGIPTQVGAPPLPSPPYIIPSSYITISAPVPVFHVSGFVCLFELLL